MTPRAHILALSAALLFAACGDPDCRTDGCDTGQVCNDATGECNPPPDKPNCVEMGCEGDLFCDAGTGACVERTRCLTGSGECNGTQCSTCPEGLVCDAGSGFCVPDEACRFANCAVAQRCNEETLSCESIECTLDRHCPTGSICAAEEVCIPGCRADGDCVEGNLCSVPAGEEAGSCTTVCAADEDCPWGERCVSADGAARCELEPPCTHVRECRDGEECRQGQCLRPLCLSDDDCSDAEYCVPDTGECADADCQDDAFEPNSQDDPWPLARGRYEGLTICRAQDDWYAVTARGTQPLRLTLSHSTDADLDIQVYRDGLLVGEASNEGALSLVQLPAAVEGELLVRVYAARGVNTTYRLFVENGPAGCEEEASEPNDLPEQAARLRSGAPAVYSTCTQDTDFVRFGAEPGAARLTVVPLGEAVSGWSTAIASEVRPFTELPRLDTGIRELQLAWLDPEAAPVLRSTSATPIRWNIEYQATPPECADATRGNHRVDAAAPLASAVTGTLCPTADYDDFEADWYELILEDIGPARVTIRVETAPNDGPISGPRLALALYSGTVAWRSGVDVDGTLTATAEVSSLDRPLRVQIYGPTGLPDMLGAWPQYDVTVETALLERCVQDRSEGTGNDRIETASPFQGTVRGVLCEGDRDVFALTEVLPTHATSSHPATLEILDGEGQPLRRLELAGEASVPLDAEVPEGARFISVSAESVPVPGATYELRAP